jgi:hypothetical protein
MIGSGGAVSYGEGDELPGYIKCGGFFGQLSDCQLMKNVLRGVN